MSTVDGMMSVDWWGPCLPEARLEDAWAAGGAKGARLPRLCSEEPTRDPGELAALFGAEPSPLQMAGAAYAYCRAREVEDCRWDSPGGVTVPPVPLPGTGATLALALAAAWALAWAFRRGGRDG
jgi:hypothetical protein